MSEKQADIIRDFADRVESGELKVVEATVRNDPPRFTIEGTNADELMRKHAAFVGAFSEDHADE
jgi:hypothetical protein